MRLRTSTQLSEENPAIQCVPSIMLVYYRVRMRKKGRAIAVVGSTYGPPHLSHKNRYILILEI